MNTPHKLNSHALQHFPTITCIIQTVVLDMCVTRFYIPNTWNQNKLFAQLEMIYS